MTMPTTEQCVFIGGWLHVAVLMAAVQVPFVLDWRSELKPLSPFLRQLFLVYSAFILLTIAGFTLISLLFASEIANGGMLSRVMAGFISFFWFARLGVQFFVFDAKPILKTWWMRLGYHALSVLFVGLVVLYAVAAFR